MPEKFNPSSLCPICFQPCEEGQTIHSACIAGYEKYKSDDNLLSDEDRKKKFIEVKGKVLAGIDYNGDDIVEAVIDDEKPLDAGEDYEPGFGYGRTDSLPKNYDYGHDRLLQDKYASLLSQWIDEVEVDGNHAHNQFYTDQIIRRLEDIGLTIEDRPELKDRLAKEIDKKVERFLSQGNDNKIQLLGEDHPGGYIPGIENILYIVEKYDLPVQFDLTDLKGKVRQSRVIEGVSFNLPDLGTRR